MSTVYAVMRVTIEIPVRSSSSKETLDQMLTASRQEAEGILRTKLPNEFRVSGLVEFSHAIVRD